MVYFKDRDAMYTLLESHILSQAGQLPITFPKREALRFNSAFNYKGDNSRHLVNKKMGSHIQKNKLLMAFHSLMVSAQLADKECNVYVVVSHGQFLNKLFKYLQTQGKQASNAPYNACAVLRLDTSKGKKVYDHVNAFTADIWKAGERIIPGQGFVVDKGKLKMKMKSKVGSENTELDSDPKLEVTKEVGEPAQPEAGSKPLEAATLNIEQGATSACEQPHEKSGEIPQTPEAAQKEDQKSCTESHSEQETQMQPQQAVGPSPTTETAAPETAASPPQNSPETPPKTAETPETEAKAES